MKLLLIPLPLQILTHCPASPLCSRTLQKWLSLFCLRFCFSNFLSDPFQGDVCPQHFNETTFVRVSTDVQVAKC